jgi:hypothetical protein
LFELRRAEEQCERLLGDAVGLAQLDRRGDDGQADGGGPESPSGPCSCCCQSRQRGVVSPYVVADTLAICAAR